MNTKQKIFAYVIVGGAVAYMGTRFYLGYKKKKDGQNMTTRPFQVSALNPVGDKVVTSGRLTNTAQSSQTPYA
jgi:hypothetical protein